MKRVGECGRACVATRARGWADLGHSRRSPRETNSDESPVDRRLVKLEILDTNLPGGEFDIRGCQESFFAELELLRESPGVCHEIFLPSSRVEVLHVRGASLLLPSSVVPVPDNSSFHPTSSILTSFPASLWTDRLLPHHPFSPLLNPTSV